jgi:CRISPR-associated protein Csc2
MKNIKNMKKVKIMNKKMNEMLNKGLIARTEDIDLKKNHGLYTKIAIISETIGFLISRNNEATELTSENMGGDERAIIPAQKWRAPERSYLLSELRKLDGIIPEDYARNMNKSRKPLQNPASLLYGDTSIGSGSNMGSIASRCYYDWSYSYEPLGEISTRLTHNTLAEDGTILHSEEGGTESNAIYNIPYIKPGIKFIRFVTLENCSLELLQLELIAILGTSRYGARTAILGDNIYNKVVAIGFSKGEKPVSSFSILSKLWNSDKYEPEKDTLEEMEKSYSSQNLIEGTDLEEFLDDTQKLKLNKEQFESICETINTKMGNDWKEFWK